MEPPPRLESPEGLESLNGPRAEALLERGLAEIGLSLLPEQRQQLLALGRLVDQWAGRMSLTGHRTPFAILQRLLLEPLALWRVAEELDPLAHDRVADLGSGAGFPGLPLAVARPACELTLVESRSRRHHFQRAAIRALGLPRVSALRGRAEDLEPVPHRVVVAQAMARPDRALTWMLPWAAPGGLLLLPGGESPPALRAHPDLEPPRIRAYRVPLGGPPRTVWAAARRPE